MARATIFVGSSGESLEFAKTIQTLLDDVGDITIWNQGVFELGETSIESLEKAINRFDFAILLLATDDQIQSRGVAYATARDNVLVEIGLFLGRLGRERTFLVRAEDESLKTPTDLAGLNVATFSVSRHAGDAVAALGPACAQIGRAIRSLGSRPKHDLERGFLSVGFELLKGPHQILESIVDSLTSLDLQKVVVYRVLPTELTHEILESNQALTDRYEELMSTIIKQGTNDIGFWDKSIYGRALNQKVNEKTIEFIRRAYLPCPETSFIGVDESYNHIGFFMMGESLTGFPSDFAWRRGIVFFGDPESRRATPISGFATSNHSFIDTVLHKWWKVLEKNCERKGQLWDARVYSDDPARWESIVKRVCGLVQQIP